MEKVVAVGEWLYDGNVPKQVLVVQTDYDFWYAIGEAEGELAPGEEPVLNDDGHSYYVRYKPGWWEGQPFCQDSHSNRDVESAKAVAEAAVPSAMAWR